MYLSTLQPYVQRLQNVTHRHTIVAAATTACLIHVIPRIVRSYRGFLDLGRGGMPYNFLGWLLQATLKLIARTDTTDAAHYSHAEILNHYSPYASLSFLSGAPALQERAGSRPSVPHYVAPQRQATEGAEAPIMEHMEGFLREMVGDNDGVLEMRPSGLEGPQFDAVWLKSWGRNGIAPAFAGRARGEVTHIHPEGSSHLTLSPRDAALTLERGWGQRHPLSGVGGILPWTYVLVYAPRDKWEVEIWKRLVLASCSFIVSAVEGQVVEITCESGAQ